MPAVASEVKTMRGRVAWFNIGKGLGFISPVEGGRDVFLHYSELVQSRFDYHPRTQEKVATVLKGDILEFEVVPSEKGPRAVNVHWVQE